MTTKTTTTTEGAKESRDRPPYTRARDFTKKYSASCFCGATEWELGGDALSAMYCHCETCQTLHGAPYQWASVLPKDKVHFTRGGENLVFYTSEERRDRYKLPCKLSCPECHAAVADEGRNMMLMLPPYIHFARDANGRKIVPEAFKASHHMFYGRRCADVKDGLDKFLGKKGEEPCDDEGKLL